MFFTSNTNWDLLAIKMPVCQYRDCSHKNKTVSQPSHYDVESPYQDNGLHIETRSRILLKIYISHIDEEIRV